jgi:phosphatidylinositol alpha-mannosyltransferase
MVLLEAMSTGRPVVASRISGFQLLMEHGKQGLMVSPADDANRFAQALLYLLDRPAERARMGREGRITAVTRYAWSSVAVQLEQLYVELLRNKQGKA